MTSKSLLIGSLLSVTGILPVAYGCYASVTLENPKKEEKKASTGEEWTYGWF